MHYRANRTKCQLPLRRVTQRWLKGKSGIKLRANAGQANALVTFTANLAEEIQHQDGKLGSHRHLGMKSLASLSRLARQDTLAEEDLTVWRRLSVEYMFHYACCGWPVVPKFHLLQHFPHFIQRSGVPRAYWVYSDETKNRQSRACGRWCPKDTPCTSKSL